MKPTYEQLEQERNELAAQVERLQLAILNAIPFVPGGSVKAGLRDAYDETPPAALASLKEQWNCPTVENGKNRYGLDVAYFRNLFNRELNRTLQDYRPHELARNLLRMAITADESVISEPEFTGELRAQWEADVLDSMADEFMHHERARSVLKWRAARSRQRTQEASEDI